MDARAAFQAVIDRYLLAYDRHDAAACAAVYAVDGQILSPFGPPVIGTAAIRAVHEEWFDEGETGKTMTIAEARAEGGTGFCLVAYAADVPDGAGGTTESRGLSLNTMTRRDGGDWVIRHTSITELDADDTGS